MHDLYDHCYWQSVPVVLLVIILTSGTLRLLQTKTKQSFIYQHGEYGLPTPHLVFECKTHMACNNKTSVE